MKSQTLCSVYTFFCLSTLGHSLPTQAAEIRLETGDPGTSSTGIWRNASGATMPLDGNRGLYAIVGGEVETYRFDVTLPETTDYTLQIFNTCYSPRSSQVTHWLDTGLGRETFVLDQDCRSDPYVGQWRTLGTYAWNANDNVQLTITTEGSNQSYVGVTAIRYLYNDEVPPEPPTENQPPALVLSASQVTVQAGGILALSASANDAEDGDLSSQVQWQTPSATGNGANFSVIAGNDDFSVTVSVVDSAGLSVSQQIPVTVVAAQARNRRFEFACVTGELTPLNLSAFNAAALPHVGAMCGRYTAQLTNNDSNQTLFYHQDQGRLDGIVATYPLDAILRNVGIAPVDQPLQAQVTPQSAYNFVGLQIHHSDFNSVNSAHMVVGQRGTIQNTIEGKTTVNGMSRVNDIGHQQLVNGRADIRIQIDASGQVSAYWQAPNLSGDSSQDAWIPYRGTGILPGSTPDWGPSRQVLVGIITYAYYSNGLPFWGVADTLEIIEHEQ